MSKAKMKVAHSKKEGIRIVKKEFKAAIVESAKKRLDILGKEWTVRTASLLTNNVNAEGVSVFEGNNKNRDGVDLALYLDDLYLDFLNGSPMDTIVEKVIELSLEIPDINPVKKFLKPENVVPVFFAAGIDTSILKCLPHRKFEDLIVGFQIEIIYGRGIMMQNPFVTERILAEWELSITELYERSISNIERKSDCCISPLIGLTESGPLGKRPGIKQEDMIYFIHSGGASSVGAAAILSNECRMELKQKMGGDYYIVPSSVCEVLAFSVKGKKTAKELHDLLLKNNKSEEAQYILSDSIYLYDSITNEVSIAITKSEIMTKNYSKPYKR